MKVAPGGPYTGAPVEGYGEAYYVPSRDFISMPAFEAFKGADHFYNTLFYEHQIELYTSMIDYLKNDCGPGGL